jgi:hypothetical protein
MIFAASEAQPAGCFIGCLLTAAWAPAWTSPVLSTLRPGIASAVFSTVRDAGVNVIMISQASSEHSICFAVKASEGDLAVKVLEKRFADAIAAGR